MKVKSIFGVSHRAEAFDKALQEEMLNITKGKNDIIDIVITPCDRVLYGLIKYERRADQPKAKEVSISGKPAKN